MFDGEGYFEGDNLKDFNKSDMKGLIAIECFVSIKEDVIIGRVIWVRFLLHI